MVSRHRPGWRGPYLIIGGPANGGPLEKELVGEKFSLWSWQGPGGPAPVRVIADLRPEAVTIIQANGQSRILFGEDGFRAVAYGTRNAIILRWENPDFVLQAAPEVTGTYSDVTGAVSPYTSAVSGPQMFFRLIKR